MVLSRMVLDLQNANARRDLSDPYEMHVTLMRLVGEGGAKPLWRLERTRAAEQAVILIQTHDEPDPGPLGAGPEPYFRTFASKRNRLLERLQVGDRFRFRLRANATVKRNGKRHGLVNEDEQLEWLRRQLAKGGAELVGAHVGESRREVLKRRRRGRTIVVHGVTFDGALAVNDPMALHDLVATGIGHARAFGFGLITLSR